MLVQRHNLPQRIICAAAAIWCSGQSTWPEHLASSCRSCITCISCYYRFVASTARRRVATFLANNLPLIDRANASKALSFVCASFAHLPKAQQVAAQQAAAQQAASSGQRAARMQRCDADSLQDAQRGDANFQLLSSCTRRRLVIRPQLQKQDTESKRARERLCVKSERKRLRIASAARASSCR